MTDNYDQKLAEFLAEARLITQNHDFGGAPNKAMFWGHTKSVDTRFSVDRNNHLCELYHHSVDPQCYKMDMLPVIDTIFKHLDKYAGAYPPEILDQSWDVFSEFFAQSADGEHAFIAANDMRRGDFFETQELPVLKARFSMITTLEPAISSDGMFACQATLWNFKDWLLAQNEQWERSYHYLDGRPYPKELIPQRL